MIYGDDLDTIAKAQPREGIMEKLDFIKIKNYSVKENVKRIRNKPQNGRKLFPKDICDRHVTKYIQRTI